MKYQDYLQSDDWKQKRTAKKKNRRCAICAAAESLDVHHLNYRQLFDVEPSDLRVLCRRCHFIAHDLMKAGTLTFTSTNHHHRFEKTKAAVKKALGLQGVNLFWPRP